MLCCHCCHCTCFGSTNTKWSPVNASKHNGFIFKFNVYYKDQIIINIFRNLIANKMQAWKKNVTENLYLHYHLDFFSQISTIVSKEHNEMFTSKLLIKRM